MHDLMADLRSTSSAPTVLNSFIFIISFIVKTSEARKHNLLQQIMDPGGRCKGDVVFRKEFNITPKGINCWAFKMIEL